MPTDAMSDTTNQPKANRVKKARWRGTMNGQTYCFEYQPKAGVIRVAKLWSRTSKTITMYDLLVVMEGQRLLPL